MNVTGQNLLEGMWFALQSCGEGLQAAAVLFERGHYGRSAALTMAARDEFGKARLLRGLWRRVDAGDTVTSDELRAICGVAVKGQPRVSHIKKQQAAQASVTLRGGPDDPQKAVIERKMQAIEEVSTLRAQGTPIEDPRLVAAYSDWHRADAELQKFVDAAKQIVPGERADLRERGLYVDAVVEAGEIRWKRPNEVTYEEAMFALMDAINDYVGWCSNLQPPINAIPDAGGSPTFAAALAAWTDKPALPEAPHVRYRTEAEAAAAKASAERE